MKETKDIVVFMDDNENVVPKEKATRVRILTTDEQGDRLEIYGFIGIIEKPRSKS
jgi:hypothetical protein